MSILKIRKVTSRVTYTPDSTLSLVKSEGYAEARIGKKKVHVAIVDPIDRVHLDGPREVPEGTVTAFKISNYSSKAEYSADCDVGYVRVVDDTVEYLAPILREEDEDRRDVSFTVNGRVFNVSVVPDIPTPVIVYPTMDMTDIDRETTFSFDYVATPDMTYPTNNDARVLRTRDYSFAYGEDVGDTDEE